MAMRRGHGEGTLYQRKDGRWEGRYTRPDGTRASVYAKTQGEARRRLTAALARYDAGGTVPVGRLTVGQYLEDWLDTTVRPSVRPSTLRSYTTRVRVHLIPALGAVKLTKLTPSHVRRMMVDKLDGGLSPQTVAQLRATLRAALNVALRDELVMRNAAALADPPKVERPKPEAMTAERAREILDAVDGHRFAPIYAFALATGLRQGEILGLQWSDVDLESATVTVRHTLQRVDGELVLRQPKSKTAQRTIPLSGTAVAALWRQKAQAAREREYSPEWPESDLVFVSESGGPLEGTFVTGKLKRLLDEAGVERVTFHGLRHGFATLMMASGANPRVVQDALGHSEITLTLGTYSHVSTDLLREAVTRLDDVLARPV